MAHLRQRSRLARSCTKVVGECFIAARSTSLGVLQRAHLAVYHPSKPSNKFKVTVAKNDTHRDLTVLAHEIPATEYYDFDVSKRTFKAGDNTTALGFPSFGPGDKINVRYGSITSLPTKSAVPLIEVTQKLSQGMSGGPLLDEDGAVAGINHKGGPSEARDFAVHIKALTDWLSGS